MNIKKDFSETMHDLSTEYICQHLCSLISKKKTKKKESLEGLVLRSPFQLFFLFVGKKLCTIICKGCECHKQISKVWVYTKVNCM